VCKTLPPSGTLFIIKVGSFLHTDVFFLNIRIYLFENIDTKALFSFGMAFALIINEGVCGIAAMNP
jgi:hypothetical protein